MATNKKRKKNGSRKYNFKSGADIGIQAQLVREKALEIASHRNWECMLWMSAVDLNEAFGFGEKRFKQFFDAMISVNHWLNENQQEGDTEYATEKLRERAQKISGMKLDSLDDIV